MKSSILFGNVHYAAVDSKSSLLINNNLEKKVAYDIYSCAVAQVSQCTV